jgi:membrane fusion protein, heavy metal efflux system
VVGTLFVLRPSTVPRETSATRPAEPLPPDNPPLNPESPVEDITINIAPDVLSRAGIQTATVSTRSVARELRLPARVQPDAYRTVTVTPVASGRVTSVSAILGQRVQSGDPLATLQSPEVAAAESAVVSLRARQEAEAQRVARAERLLEIGAASKQELETARAEVAASAGAVEEALARLRLFGAERRAESLKTARDVTGMVMVTAPSSGEIIDRQVNPGQPVEAATPLFVIADTSRVWLIASAYERDLQWLRTGVTAGYTVPAAQNSGEARIAYIDPALDPATRTASVRLEAANPGGRLRFGMLAEVNIAGTPGETRPVVPRDAIQSVGARHFVYMPVAGSSGRFIEREVTLGEAEDGMVEVRSGLNSGDAIVTHGSFFLRAERDRTHPRRAEGAGSPRASIAAAPWQPASAASSAPLGVKVRVTEKGFEPAEVHVIAGRAARLELVRTTDVTCGTELVIADLNVKRQLPLHEAVAVDIPAGPARLVQFTCGMNMLRGTVSVQEKSPN